MRNIESILIFSRIEFHGEIQCSEMVKSNCVFSFKLSIEIAVLYSWGIQFMQKQFVLVSENHVRTGGKQICVFRYKNQLGCMIQKTSINSF